MDDFRGRSALVTGGASGIGLATAQCLLDRGADVMVCGHDGAQLEAALHSLQAGSGRVHARLADVRDLSSMQAAADELAAHTGRIDHLVSAAGIQIPGTALTASEADWLAVLDVNLSGAFRACKAVLPAMVRGGGGSIVIVSSVQALRGKRNGVAYVASKGGLNAMVRALALDHAPQRVRVNVVCPGVVDTPMLREAALRAFPGTPVDETVTAWAQLQPLGDAAGQPCQPHDVAQAAMFLLSDAARYVTGAEFSVDGGLSAKLALG
jgi:NAD(P)-dependent dehydrogenase (short-subunit alcohol dehydrogenase family)